MSSLDTAVAALKKNDFDTALEALIALWRETQSSALADAIDQLSAIASAQRTAIGGRTRKEQGAAWTTMYKKARAGDFTTLITALPGVSSTEAERRARLLNLIRRKPDPRLSGALLRWLDKPPRELVHSTNLWFWRTAFEALEKLQDPRTARALPAVLKRFRASHQTVMEDDFVPMAAALLETSAGWKEKPLDVSPLAPFLVERAPAEKMNAAAALAAVYRSPHDLGLRRVCADALTEAGDERGEFITLQLEGKLTAKQRARHDVLLKRCADSMLGPIADFAMRTGLKFANGFPVAARVTPMARLGDPHAGGRQKATVAAPQWSTFEVLDVSDWKRPTRELLQTGMMRSLKQLIGADVTVFSVRRPMEQLETLTVHGIVNRGAHRALFSDGVAPRLKTLHFDPRALTADEAFKSLWASPVMKQLESLSMSTSAESIVSWKSLLDEVPENMKTLKVRLWPLFVQWQFERTKKGWRGELSIVNTDRADAERVAAELVTGRKVLKGVELSGEAKVAGK